MHGSVHCQVWIEGGGGLRNEGSSFPPPAPARRLGREATLRVPRRRLSTQPNTRRSPAHSRGPAPATPVNQRGLASPRPGRPPPLSVLQQKEKTEGQGAAVPGDFTLFEASVFRRCRCHPRRFSLLLHRHLPPSPAGRAGEPGKGVAACWGLLRAGSRFPETAASEGAEPPASPRAAQPGRRSVPGPLPVLLSAGPRGLPACRHFSGLHRRQNANGAALPPVTHSDSQRYSLTRMRIFRGRKWRDSETAAGRGVDPGGAWLLSAWPGYSVRPLPMEKLGVPETLTAFSCQSYPDFFHEASILP